MIHGLTFVVRNQRPSGLLVSRSPLELFVSDESLNHGGGHIPGSVSSDCVHVILTPIYVHAPPPLAPPPLVSLILAKRHICCVELKLMLFFSLTFVLASMGFPMKLIFYCVSP